jgi:hypothetical protein
MVERNDAMDFGAREIQRFRDDRNRLLRDMAELFLKGMKDREHGAFERQMFGDDPPRSFGIPSGILRHRLFLVLSPPQHGRAVSSDQ